MAAHVKLETEDEEEVGTPDENSSQEDGDCELDRMLSSHDSNGSSSERHMSLGMDAAGLTESQYALPQSMMFTDEEQAMVDMDISNETGVLKFNMDIREPLSRLRTTLEHRLEIDLTDYEFYLQDVTRLDDDKNMVEQCMQGEGVVQINVQLKVDANGVQKINIVDVLKPSEEFVEIGAFDDSNEGIDGGESDAEPYSGNPLKPGLVRWMIDVQFKKEMEQLHIPQDPAAWNKDHVRHWLKWAVRTFNLSGVKLADWNLTGEELCNLSLEDYHSRVPSDPGDTFWLHLQLMRKCKFVAVMHQVEEDVSGIDRNGQIRERKGVMNPRIRPHQSKLIRMGRPRVEIMEPLPSLGCGNRTGNNGQIQLWQFLLELLTDKEFIHAIQWLGAQGEFKLSNPELVAQLWGARKNKPLMNYEKLSRALRYYYDGEMIAKVPGKRFVYKFVCDLKELVGYSAAELNQRVLECEAAYQEQLDAQQSMLSSGEFCLVGEAEGDAKMEAK